MSALEKMDCPEMSHLRHADITDCVKDTHDETRVRITGFYRIETRSASPLLGGGTVLGLMPCLPDDPCLAAISTYAICGKFHRPWDLVWERKIPWAQPAIDEEQRDWRETVEKNDFSNALKSTGYPEIFEHFSPMTAHEKLAILAWRRQTDALIRESEGVHSRT